MTDQRKGKIQTVCGLIEPEELGPTLLHEHILWDETRPEVQAAAAAAGPVPPPGGRAEAVAIPMPRPKQASIRAFPATLRRR